MQFATVVVRVCGEVCDVGLVDVVARLVLEARRTGCPVQVRDLAPELRDLLQLVGLSASVEVLGEAEHGEQAGLDEGVLGHHPAR